MDRAAIVHRHKMIRQDRRHERGGGYSANYGAGYSKVSRRDYAKPTASDKDRGFRVVLVP